MIRLVLYIVLYMIPAIILGGIILSVIPHISMWQLVILNTGIIVGIFQTYKNKKRKELDADGQSTELPSWLKSKAVVFFLFVASFFASFLIFGFNKTSSYIDNASDKDIVVNVSQYGSVTIDANSYQKLSVVKGDIEFEYNDKKKKYSMPSGGNWIFNIDNLNSYFRTSVEYSREVDLYKDKKEPSSHEHVDLEVIEEEFFNSKVDYVFDVPEKISVKAGRYGKKGVSKKVLYRMNDNMFTDEEEEDDPEIEHNKLKIDTLNDGE